MLTHLPIAAIDVGSNAIRFMLAEFQANGKIIPLKKFRRGLRLGHDAFTHGRLTSETIKKLIDSFMKFRRVMNNRKILHYRAVATSALRDSKNGKKVLESILAQTGIKLEIIDALEEGRLIHKALSANAPLHNKNTLLIDIGGGSVEITHSFNGNFQECVTFPAGTVRILESLRRKKLKEDQLPRIIGLQKNLFTFIKKLKRRKKIDFIVGSGGNFECILRLRVQILKKTESNKFTLKELQAIILFVSQTSISQRMNELDMHSDRADVILPACYTIEKMMQTAGVDTCIVPGCGLKEGILYELRDKLLKF